jgi:DNA polymerase I-like protein with 3'-5' exonuclease and polymerase domains
MNSQAYKLFHEGILAFADMENNGIRIDVGYCRRQKRHIEQQITMLGLELDRSEEVKMWRKVFGDKFSIDSNDQLKKILFTHMGLTPPVLTDKGNPSVDKESLYLIDSPIVKPLIQLRLI